ncbi:MAG TPA: hypothetical protein VGO11_14470 [Chthoniobacteraceae bacterium]|nr:hypothetical protein [Chthoniobacteraceae bacterium]
MKLFFSAILLSLALHHAGFAAPAGEPSKGLVTRIELERTKFKPGEPILVRYTKTNVSKGPLTVWHSAFWPNHRIRVCDQLGAPAPLTESGKVRYGAFAPGGSRDKNYPVEMAPGKDDVTEGNYNLLEFFDLKKPGLYSVQYLYEEYQSGWQGQAWSNVVVIEIAEK